MGVQGIFPMLRKLGMSDTPVDNALTLGIDTIHYDVKACHYGDMMREMTNVRHSDSTGVIAALAATIDQKIKLWRNHLDKDVTFVLHIDAPGSAAKGPTHLKRHLKREAAARKLEYNLRVLERKKGRWVPHKVIGRIDKDLRTCCQLTLETRDVLVAALKHLGHDVCVCRAETDPCIATQCYQHEGPKEAAVLSIDSDYLFYQGVKTLLRPNPKGPGLLHYSRVNVKKALGLIRDEELIVYGCVNRNDYNSNVPTIGLVRSLKLIRPDAENEDSDASSYNSDASGNDPESSGDDPESSGNDSDSSDEESTSDDEGSHSGYTETDSDTEGRPAKKRAKTLSSRKPLSWSDKGKAPMRNARALVADAAAEASSSRISILRSDKGRTPVRNVDVSMDVDTAVPEAQSGGQLRSNTFQNQPLQGHVGTDLGSLASLRQLIAQFCDDVGAIVKMRVPVSMFEASLRTFGFLSQLKTGEEPEDHEDQIPLWEEPTDDEPDSLSPLSLLQLPNQPEPEKSPDELLQTFQLQFKDYCRLRRARRETFYPPERVEEFKRPHNQYGHAFRKDKDGRHTFLNGRTVTIDSSKEKRVPPKPISRVIQSTAARGQKSKKNKKNKRRRKKKPVQTKRKQDRIEKQPEGAGAVNRSQATKVANRNKRKFETRALQVGGFQKNVGERLKLIEGLSAKGAENASKELTKRHRSCLETRDLLMQDTYNALMLAIEDIHNPSNLAAQSIKMRTVTEVQEDSSSSSVSAGAQVKARERWDLPEKYPDTMLDDLVTGMATFYALPTLFFYGEAGSNSEDVRIRKQAQREGGGQTRRTRAQTRSTRAAFNNGKDSWTANQKESAAHIPAIRWFQEQNKEGIFKDFVFGSNARKYQVVTEQDLYCFLKAAPPPSTQPQPQYLSEISRFDFEPLLKGLFPKARRGDDMKEGQRADYINDNKGWLTTSLLYDRAPQHVTEGRVPGRDGYCHKVKLQSETSNRRYILGTGYHSDGKVLTLLASDTFSEKPIRKRKKKLPTFGPEDEDEVAAAAACAGSGEGNGDGDDDDDDDDDDDEDENEEGAMGKRGKCKAPVPISSHLYEKDDKHACYEFAPPEDLQAFLVGTKSGYQCNLASRTKLLPNAALLKWDSANSPKIIIGGDPGEHVALATTRIERGSSDVRNTVKIRRTMLYEPHWRFRRALGEKKKEELIDILESMTPSRKLGNVVQYLNFMNSNIQEALLPHARSDDDRAKISLMSGTVGEVIFAFYHSSWLLKKMWDCKKAQRSALDLAVGAVLAQAGFKPNSKRQDQPTVIFAYGMARFNTRRGPASKAVVVEKKVVKALRGLGQIVVGEHEYFTSQKCPRRDCDEFLEKLDNRSMYCRKCNMFFDRDAVGSENIAFICQEFVEGRTRPAKFLPATTVVAAPATSIFVPTAAGSS
ncbi:hypothetical protein EMPS_08562 [Entomortierella parvispora]|uniref:Cas12f1-like TNB domain-containing protein n=1 Tax=Entomortierella parvispora TaxID=205924 RepID=A0A9P3HGX2_9FUNG|nr:hypothetical protein EMPS_08562 [Entomortierella parvispora]